MSLAEVANNPAVHRRHGLELGSDTWPLLANQNEPAMHPVRLGCSGVRSPHVDRGDFRLTSTQPLDQHGALRGEANDLTMEPILRVPNLDGLANRQAQHPAEFDLFRRGRGPWPDPFLIVHKRSNDAERLCELVGEHTAFSRLWDVDDFHASGEVLYGRHTNLDDLARQRGEERAEAELGVSRSPRFCASDDRLPITRVTLLHNDTRSRRKLFQAMQPALILLLEDVHIAGGHYDLPLPMQVRLLCRLRRHLRLRRCLINGAEFRLPAPGLIGHSGGMLDLPPTLSLRLLLHFPLALRLFLGLSSGIRCGTRLVLLHSRPCSNCLPEIFHFILMPFCRFLFLSGGR
mmetsp:Transcript_97977/g.245434  ORF Transcript_97977/g.245434 Transcript_97977/m.245434 type:complete len:346 (+) Transcript_97977:1749-2786(+)